MLVAWLFATFLVSFSSGGHTVSTSTHSKKTFSTSTQWSESLTSHTHTIHTSSTSTNHKNQVLNTHANHIPTKDTAAPEADVQKTTSSKKNILRGMSKKSMNEMLELHNLFRSRIATGYFDHGIPKAANMQKMRWDVSLQREAQLYSNKCHFVHSGTKGMGENIFWGSRNNWQVDAVMSAWSNDEVKHWRGMTVKQGAKDKAGHAKQVAWWNTNRVGCGWSYCKDGDFTLVVCNYKKQGNIYGQPIFAVGEPCSQCSGKCDQRSKLCL